jgi:multiple sugar transport system substrate-binding protein
MILYRYRRASAVLLATGLALSVAACGDSDKGSSAGGKTTITVNCEPAKDQKLDRKFFEDDIKTFEKANPDIHIVAHDAFPCDDPKTFDAKLSGGQMEDVYYVYFTDVAKILSRHQAADISPYTASFTGYADINPSLMSIFKDGSKVYGLPRNNYSMGLLYSRKLFKQAGLNPDQPPKTWDEVRADAKKISELGNGTVGYGDFSANNQGGWHFVSEMYSQGGSAVSSDGKHATVDTAQGKAVLQNLKDMRFGDNSMGSKQLLKDVDLQTAMGAGKLGMFVAAPDNIPLIVKQFKGNYDDLAMAPMPDQKGTLIGGDGYMFNVKDTPAQIKAGLKWLQFENLTPGKGRNDWKRAAASGAPVGLPEPALWVGPTADKDNAIKKQYANVPIKNFQQFLETGTTVPGQLEPPQAQQIYSVMDSVVSAVLTNKNANIDSLLKDANGKIDQLLAQQN